MKKDIHPQYNDSVEVICICWNKFDVKSTVKWPIKVESCPACHPVYTGKKETKVVKGRMEKYLERQKKIEALKDNQ